MIATKTRDALPHFSTLSGSPKDIRTKLADMTSQQRIIAFAFDQGNEQDIGELADVMHSIALMINDVKMHNEQRQHKAYQAVVEALIAPVPLPNHKIAEAKMTARARNAVLESGDWLTAGQVAEMAGFSKTNPSAQPNKWKQDGAIFAIKQNGVDYFPGYALNPDTKFRPHKALADIIKAFGNTKDAWGLAYWFASVNSFLGGMRPQDALANKPAQVIAAAKDEVGDLGGVAHA